MAQSSEAREVKKAREADDGSRREPDASEHADDVTTDPQPPDAGSASAQEAEEAERPRVGSAVSEAAAPGAVSEAAAPGAVSGAAAPGAVSEAAVSEGVAPGAVSEAAVSEAAAPGAVSEAAAPGAVSEAAAPGAVSGVAAPGAMCDSAAPGAMRDSAAPGAVSAAAASAPLESLSLRDEPIPRVPPAAVGGPWRSYKEILATLAQRVLDAQRPIRILQALRWDAEVEEQFLRSKQRELPRVTYSDDLGFDPEAKLREIEEILRDAERELGKRDRLGQILRTTADEYRRVVRMLMGRGTREFYTLSRELYGSPKDKFPDGKTSVRDMGFVLYDLLTAIGGERLGPPQAREITAEMAALELNARFDRFFGGASIRVQVDDSLLADAAAGSDYVKIRSGAVFSKSDIDILEAHEGWVHVATSLNGQAQPVARWLAKGPPRTTAVQEGLAVLLEILTFRSTPRRAKKLNDRILAVDKAEDGASFLDVFEWYRTEGYEEEECFQNARRVFRGGLLEGGAPFTKDACYCKGIVLNYAFMRAAIQNDRAMLIPFLFVGKVAHEDVPVLYAHLTDGIVRPPPYLPPLFDDMNGLAIWICYSSFFSRLGGTAIAEHYGRMLNH